MSRILSRLLVRVAIVVASLAWAGFVFTETIGDPGRGEQVASAVLADDAARAEVVAPVSASVMRTAGLPPELRPVVDAEVDRALRDPRGAQAFIDPFAGAWARLLGEDDPRPPEFDLAPLLGQLTIAPPDVIADRIPVPDVPLPRTRLGWMDGVRSTISASVLPLALAAAGLFAAAFALGERARVLRRFGAWAIAAGLTWVVLPPLAVWAARRWAPGADAVIAAALDEATSGLVPIALTLVAVGLAAFAWSFAVRPASARTRSSTPPRQAPARPVRRVPTATPATVGPVPPPAEVMRRPVETTAEMPAVGRPTAPTPTLETGGESGGGPGGESTVGPGGETDGDDLWDYYTS